MVLKAMTTLHGAGSTSWPLQAPCSLASASVQSGYDEAEGTATAKVGSVKSQTRRCQCALEHATA